ncbi:30S ribosomal protein 3, chloroplastic [Ancistrocladus abbreviatus]
MLSMAAQPNINSYIKPSIISSPSPKLLLQPFKASAFPHRKRFSSSSLSVSRSKYSRWTTRGLTISANTDAVTGDSVNVLASSDDEFAARKEKLGVVVKPMEKPRLVLKFIWMEKNIGLALDQAIPGHGTIPLSPYYFWPRKDAWEELKILLESKPWISQKQMIILLNQATDIINLWQQSGGNLA